MTPTWLLDSSSCYISGKQEALFNFHIKRDTTTGPTSINHATFTGLLTGGATTGNIGEVRVEIRQKHARRE